ncbi:D,D-dipeptide ABC transporter permease, partial [Klebsiella pneumoniae]
MNATLRHAGWVLRTNPVTAIAAFGTALMLTVAILSPWLMPHDPLASNVPNALRPPSAAHWA